MSTRDAVTARAPGKLNLSLGVGRRRDDGYHPLATVFQAVSLYEEVVATAADELTVTVEGPGAEVTPTDATNLAWRAAELVAAEVGIEPAVHLHLRKQVPVAGGMAGGSADAAAALLACETLWDAGLTRERIALLAGELGADVPFLLHGHTAVGTGRGDLISPALCRGRYHWALATRRSGLSTADVYGRFDDLAEPGLADPEPDRELLTALRAADLEAVGRNLGNDLQGAALELAPDLAQTVAAARSAGALGVVVTGSGPTVAALARSRRHAMAIGAAVTAAGQADEVAWVVGPVGGARVL
ncbi:4-(cytidine 5'-diphospho)-2-C-methyl-D-erythritol kinase [Actinotalea sp. M2MS4P-6]|uniref:4-(cytidine 5'-diphospho)-2-C-methyl-D-erythritol kinase n=1 Tax=Actinotalea sp. M2MS4P-6 TaxID=2983762 RepID=UPI0021E3BFF2|nr:4-(cytidine 5'-diphospho)-2-C-methyl-D-erythritol kinase [Actinotalea sp. M2MS4P-6]MCV2395796.1 4-(cytidine 5'-diphospho)-2-C-methyl-D-erythritol kinase [Actinotalea sp. M2MS4P-6]